MLAGGYRPGCLSVSPVCDAMPCDTMARFFLHRYARPCYVILWESIACYHCCDTDIIPCPCRCFVCRRYQALLHFCESAEAQSLEMLFREGGDPLLFQSHSNTFAGELIMATMEVRQGSGALSIPASFVPASGPGRLFLVRLLYCGAHPPSYLSSTRDELQPSVKLRLSVVGAELSTFSTSRLKT